MSPALRHLALQFVAVLAVLSLVWPYYGIQGEHPPWPATAWAIGAVAFGLAAILRSPWWWLLIHAGFVPLAWLVGQWEIDPGWFLLLFLTLLMIYRGALTGQVPLYLSNRTTAAALARLMSARPGARFLDLGAGIGSVLAPLSHACPEGHYSGVENAPLTWLIGRLRLGLTRRPVAWLWGSLWRMPLGDYDVVYAFLSPAPMPRLWAKVEAEMRPGSLFVSNSFEVPGVVPSEVIELNDGRNTRLYCYRR